MMCSRCPVCRLKDMRGLGGHDKDGDDDDDNRTCCQVRSAGSSCEAFRDNHCLDQMIIICRKYEQTEEGKSTGEKRAVQGKVAADDLPPVFPGGVHFPETLTSFLYPEPRGCWALCSSGPSGCFCASFS
uniref:uncharacterized protein LOC122778141 isoform X3 n=1 Tax=Solea senegalensis TaxID=28829 RepID=UPI001CD86502|nr:uncharacterized protein LOC122778141 isoform X3 [Solea senegalensis]